MNKKKWKLAVFLTSLCSLPALAITSEEQTRPRPESYASYSLYLQALFDYQRAQEPKAANTSKPVAKPVASNTTESLDNAIANSGQNPGYVDTSAKPRSTFRSFALSQIPAQDMSTTTIDNALGNFSNHTMQQPPRTVARLRPDSGLHLFEDSEISLLQDASNILWRVQQQQAVDSYAGHITLPEGESDASASASIGDEPGSLDLTLSAKVRSNVYITDRDGIPHTSYWHAGAVAIQPLALQMSNLTTHITTPRNRGGDRYVAISASSPNAIYVDLSGSRFGVADANEGAGRVALSRAQFGRISYFAKLGDEALLTIAPGMKLDIKLDKPDGLRKPFVTLNGKVSDISLGDIGILSKNTGEEEINGAHISKMRISGINLVNAGLYIQDESIVLDVGSGIRDMSIVMERLAMGSGNIFVGDFYTQNIGIANTRITFSAH